MNPNHPQSEPSASNTNPPGRKKRKTALLILSGLLLAILSVIALLPSILGSKWIYQKLVDQLEVEGFQLKIDNAKFAWLSPISLNGISLEQLNAPNDRRNLLTIDSIASNRSLLGYILNGRNLGKITIRNPKLAVELLEDSSNIEKLSRSLENSALINKKDKKDKKDKRGEAAKASAVAVRRTSDPLHPEARGRARRHKSEVQGP
jgi:hypothetical protein